MRPIAAALLSLVFASPAAAQTVGLEDPACASLPFDQRSMRTILELELEVDGWELTPGESDAALSWAPEPCEPGVTRYRIALRDAEGRVTEARVDLAEVPLGTLPRALALELVGLFRERGRPAGADPVDAAERPAAAARADPTPATMGAPSAEANADTVAVSDADTVSDADPASPETHAEPSVRFVVLGHLRNTPDSSALLFGPRVGLELPLALGLPLTLRLDAAAAFGPADHGAVLAAFDGGLALAIAAQAAQGVAVRFGPRLWLGHAAALEAPGAARQSDDAQVGLGLRVGVDLALAPGIDLLLEGEVGANLHGLELSGPAGRTGFLGAYWGLDVGLGFR